MMAESLKNRDDLVAVNVMVSPGERSREAFRETLTRPSIVDFTQTFPAEVDEELNRLYVLKVRSSEVEEVLSDLRQSAAVEYAEAVPKRRLIR